MKGIPIKQMTRYCTVPVIASCGTLSNTTSGFTKISKRRVEMIEIHAKSVIVLPIVFSTSLCFFAPTA